MLLASEKYAWIELTSRSLTQQPFLYRVVVLDAGTRSAQLAGPALLPGKIHRTDEGPDGHLEPALPECQLMMMMMKKKKMMMKMMSGEERRDTCLASQISWIDRSARWDVRCHS